MQAAKPGCSVFLSHYISEGRRNHYGGPHQWNLFPREGRFLIDRPGLRAIDVGERLQGIADVDWPGLARSRVVHRNDHSPRVIWLPSQS